MTRTAAIAPQYPGDAQRTVVTVALTVQTELAEHATPDNLNVIASLPRQVDLTSPPGQAIMNGMVQRQSALVAYIDSFHLRFMMCLAIIPLLFFLRTIRASHA